VKYRRWDARQQVLSVLHIWSDGQLIKHSEDGYTLQVKATWDHTSSVSVSQGFTRVKTHLPNKLSTWSGVLWLYRCRMDSTMVEGFLDLGCHMHEVVLPRRGDMD